MSNVIKKALMPRIGDIPPQSVAAAATATTAWIAARDVAEFVTMVNLGALQSGSVALTFQQATDSGGSGAKALTTGVNVGSSAVDNANFEVDNDISKLDHENGFDYFRAVLTVTGGSGSLVSAIVCSGHPRYID
jgi:hypothetical protein